MSARTRARLEAAAPTLLVELQRSTALLVLLEDAVRGTDLDRLAESITRQLTANRVVLAKARFKT